MRFWQEIREGLIISFASIRANKLRSALTTLGIIIGIVTVTLVGTAINGLNNAFTKSISALGSDSLFVRRGSWFIDSDAEWQKVRRRPPITLDQVEKVSRQMTLARAVAPFAITRQSVTYKNKNSASIVVIGTTEDFVNIAGNSVSSGRFFNSLESAGGRPICAIGNEVATNLFKGEDPLGKRIKVGNQTLEVVGIMTKQGSFLGEFSLDNQIIIPVRQYVTMFRREEDFEIQIRVASMEQMEEAKEELTGILRRIRHVPLGQEDNFAINQQEMFIKTFNRIGGAIATAGLFITGLSLFVGGIGIMNIMFVSVAERTKEIGIRKAIGAKRRTILLQFLAEAAGICLFGGVLALLIAFPLTLVMNQFLPATMNLTIVGIALLVSAMTGVISGFLPAWRAARMNPVDALRSE